MTYKRLLVPVTGDPVAALATALLVARRFGASIEALAPRPGSTPFLQFAHGDIDQSLYQEAMDELAARERERLAEAEAAVQRFADTNSVPLGPDPGPGLRLSYRVPDEDEADPVARIGGACDLIVAAGRGGSESTEILEAALFRTGRPVLLAPKAAPATIGDAVVIGWNRSIQSGRALFAVLPLLRPDSRVRIVSVATGAKSGPHFDEVARTLVLHGVEPEIRELPPDYRYIGEVLLEEASEFGADMLAMGAYSHSRLRERVLGGVTRQVLEQAALPVLMAR